MLKVSWNFSRAEPLSDSEEIFSLNLEFSHLNCDKGYWKLMDYFYMNVKMERKVNRQSSGRKNLSSFRLNVALIFVWWNLFKDHKISQTHVAKDSLWADLFKEELFSPNSGKLAGCRKPYILHNIGRETSSSFFFKDFFDKTSFCFILRHQYTFKTRT